MADETEARYQRRVHVLALLAQKLAEQTSEALRGVRHVDRISFRVKTSESFAEKAAKPADDTLPPDEWTPKYNDPWTEIEDQVAGRVLTFFRDDLQVVGQALVERFGAVERVVKEPKGPKESDYESEHYVFTIAEHHKPEGWGVDPDMPTTFELQVRTLFMHAWAEPQHDLGYKSDGLQDDMKRELAWIAASSWGADRTLNDVARGLDVRFDVDVSIERPEPFIGR